MEALKDKISTWLKGVQENINSYKLVEKQKRIFYFSKFSLDIYEFFQIYKFVKTIKQIVFTSMHTKMKNCVKYLTFSDNQLSEEDKIMTLFSALFLHYYSSFSYNTAHVFDDYYNLCLVKLCEGFKINIKNTPKFQTLALYFYENMKIAIINNNYEHIKKYFQYYNPNLMIEENNNNINNNVNNNKNTLIINNNIDNLINPNKNGIKDLQNKFLIQLVTAKERIVEMVVDIKNKTNSVPSNSTISINSENSNIDMNNYYYESNTNIIRNKEKEKNFIESSLQKINKDTKKHLNESMSIDKNDFSENESTDTNNTIYSKRVLCELQKCEIDEHTNLYVNKLSEKINDLYLDKVLNMDKKYKKITCINYFICYVVEFNSELIKNIEGNNGNNFDIYNDLNLRFIVSAKEIYNLVMEIYFSICDLNFTTVNTFYEMCLKKGIQIKYAVDLYPFFRKLTKLLVSVNNNCSDNEIIHVFQELYNLEFALWEKEIKEKGQELTSFCKI